MSSSYPVDFTLIDNTKEKTTFTVYHDEVTVTTLPTLLVEVNDFKVAVNALCFNSVAGFDNSLQREQVNPLPIPVSKYAQKENKLVITYRSKDVNKIPKLYQISIGCVDLNLLTITGVDKQGRDIVDYTTAGPVKNVVDKFKLLASIPDDPNDGDPIIDGVYFQSE